MPGDFSLPGMMTRLCAGPHRGLDVYKRQVRVMARELGINPNTVAKAYQDLEKSGLIYSVAGKGSFISGEETLDRQVAVSVLDHLREARCV